MCDLLLSENGRVTVIQFAVADAYLDRFGKALFDEGRLDEAEEVFRKAIGLQAPDGALMMAHYHLGRIYRQSGQAEKAATHLEIFSKLKSKSIESTDR